MTAGIYQINIDKYFYIGCSINIEKRVKTHLSLLRKQKSENSKMQNIYNKYLVFSWTILEITKDLQNKEIEWVNNVQDKSNLMNIADPGGLPPKLIGEKNPNYKKGKFGKLNPMFGKNRPDLSLRNKLNRKPNSVELKRWKSRSTTSIDFNIKLISPDNKIIWLQEYNSLREFCKIYKLDRKSVYNLIKQKNGCKTVKGWTLCH